MQHNTQRRSLKWRLEGPFDSSYSLALLNREIARALDSLGVEVALFSTEGPGDFEPSADFLEQNPDLKAMYARALAESAETADICSRNLYPPRVVDMKSDINILHSYAWEESSFPTGWKDDFNAHLTGVSCLSEHVLKIMQDNGVSVPSIVSGCGVDHWERVVANPHYSLDGTGAKAFRFLHISSCFPRKGPEALLEGYGRAFSASDDVSLVIKTFPNPHNEIEQQLARYREANPNYPHVVLIQDDLDDPDLKALYEKCDVLVAPSCAEGFGLPLAEAMLSGLPVIATGWSGQLDFCDAQSSWLVDYRFEQADTHFRLLPSAWAAIDRQALANAMIAAHQASSEERKRMANAGRERLLREFTWSKVAQRLVAFRQQLADHRLLATPKVGWITTWNVKCGIATYSEHLLSGFSEHPLILAADDANIQGTDGDNCRRCWAVSDIDDLSALTAEIERAELDVLMIQFNFGFFHHDHLNRFIAYHKAAGRIVLIDLHATNDPPQTPGKHMRNYLEGLSRCDRVLVHSIDDMNRMKDFGLIENVVLFPHGILDVPEPTPRQRDVVPTVATYGFCLPHKGLAEIVEAVALLRDTERHVNLRMVNAEYPAPQSRELAELLRARINELGVGDRVTLESRFLPDDESLKLLQDSDLVIFAYHPTSESSSGAVRYGLACGRPTLVTDLPIFKELGESVWTVQNNDPAVLAERLWQVLREIRSGSVQEQRRAQTALNWRTQHNYSALSKRLDGLITGLHRNKALL
ncbi:glycosyltransferase family 4 protein [Burkholderia ubonensis]|uniref:glycosyltransferase family 4 protein n=1 Tax=Burkholderia ubonensis TaxID=101571 RepID=UPI002AAFD999|nr:glycosyltransferase [Burkholderia ubonensis]